MPAKIFKPLLLLAAIGLLIGAGQVQRVLTHDREVLGLTRYTELKGAPPVLALTTVALGGFRGLISNALWIRAGDLQDDGKYFEMVQLADWITKLEPHFTQVWLVQGWNMAYNISVKFKDYADRWRWVQRGIELLRDEGLKYNPHDVLIHRELAWFFQHKMGANLDDAHLYYKVHWAMEMNQIFGTNVDLQGSSMPKVDWDRFIHPKTDEDLARTGLLTNKYKLEPTLMKQVDDHYGPLEWRLPEAHAIYWAQRGLDEAARNERKIDPNDLITLRRVIYQSMQLSFQRGRLIPFPTDKKRIEFGPNLDIIPKVSAAYEQAMNEDEKNRDHIETAHRNLVREAVFDLYTYNRIPDATAWFKYLGEKYPNKPLLDGKPDSLPGRITLFDYAVGRLGEEVEGTGVDKAKTIVEGLEATALRSLAMGEEDRFLGYQGLADQFYKRYMDKVPEMSTNRVSLAPMSEIRQTVFDRLMDRGILSRESAMQLVTALRLNMPSPRDTNAPPADAVPANAPGTNAVVAPVPDK